ncbi:MAG: sulfite oxidase-like oxidoreductase [Planctomycetota bacterium]|nr:sulfite oxidase-like oxidoreductase [Planctomycetota bacterium]
MPAVIISPDCLRGGGKPASRTPPGQTLTAKWPVLHYGGVPSIKPESWSLRIFGLVEREITLDWKAFDALPKVDVRCDIHCVTHWSRLDNLFTGVATRTLLDLARPLPAAKFVIEHARSEPNDDFTTNLPLDAFAAEDCLLATHHDGRPLTAEHGAPVRGIVPRLYFWKGAKWITGIELVDRDRPGFWEVNGYHMLGDPWREERFGW